MPTSEELRTSLITIIEKYEVELKNQPNDPITNYPRLRSTCEALDLEESLSILTDCSPETLPESFKIVAEQRRLLTKGTALSFSASPQSPANKLYQEFFIALFPNASLITFLNVFAPEVDTLLKIKRKFKLRKSPDQKLNPKHLELQVEIEEVKLEESSLPNLKSTQVIIIDNKILLVPSVTRFSSSAEISWAFIHKTYALLLKHYPRFYEKLLSHNRKIKQAYEHAALFDTRLGDRLTQLIQQLKLGGSRTTGQSNASKAAEDAVVSFQHYLDALPANVRAIKTKSGVTLEKIIVIDLIDRRECVETAAGNLQSIVENFANRQWLDFVPNAQASLEVTKPKKITRLPTEGSDCALTLPEHYLNQAIAKIDLAANQEEKEQPAVLLGQFLANFDPAVYPNLLKANNLINIIANSQDLHIVIIYLNYSQLSAALTALGDTKLLALLPEVRILIDLLNRLGSEQQEIVITAIERLLPDLILDFTYLIPMLRDSSIDICKLVLMAIKDKLPTIINEPRILVGLLEHFDIEKCKLVLTAIETHLPTLFPNLENQNIANNLPIDKKLAVNEAIFKAVIKNIDDLKRILSSRTDSEGEDILRLNKAQLPGIIKTWLDFSSLWQERAYLQRSVLLDAMGTQLPDMIHTLEDLTTALSYLRFSTNEKIIAHAIITATKEWFSKLITNSDQLVTLLNNYNELQVALIIDIHKEKLLSIFNTLYDLNVVMRRLPKPSNIIVAIKEKLPIIFYTSGIFASFFHEYYDRQSAYFRIDTSIVYDAMEKHIPDLIHSGQDLEYIHYGLFEEQIYKVIIAIKDKLPNIIHNASDLEIVLKYSHNVQIDEILIKIHDKLPNLIHSYFDLNKISCYLGTTEQANKFFSAIEHRFFYWTNHFDILYPSYHKGMKRAAFDRLSILTEQKIKQFIQVYSALREGQSSLFFKTNFLKKLAGRMSNSQLYTILDHATKNPHSRTAEALRIIKTARNEQELKLLIYQSAFKKSHWFATSKSLSMGSCCNFIFFKRNVDKIKQIPDNSEPKPGTRYFKICQQLSR